MTQWGAAARARMTLVLAVWAMIALAPADAGARPPLVARSVAPPGDEGTAPPVRTSSEIVRPTGEDQPDADPGKKQTHIVYFVPKDRADEQLDTSGTLVRSVDSIRAWFGRETSKNSRTARRPRIDRLPSSAGGGYDITFVRGDQDAAYYDSLMKISDELIRKKLNVDSKRYLIYAAVARGSTCGEGYFPIPEVSPAAYAAVYLDSNTGCGARDFGDGTAGTAGKAETIAVQEWLHNEGVTPIAAPHHCALQRFHVCTGPLFYLPGGVDPETVDVSFPFVALSLRDKVLDRDRDDYLDHAWPHLADLRASPWLE